MIRRVLTAMLLAGVATAAIAGCGGSSSDDGEGITLYSGRVAPLIGPLIDKIEARTGKDIKTRFGETPQLAAQVIEEGEASPADVFLAQDAGALGALDRAGLLMKLPDDILEKVPPRFRAPDGDWVGTSARARVIAYGRDVKPEELPKSVLDLTDPKWKGRVGWAPTNGSFEAFVTAMRKELGEDVTRKWLEGMVANDTQVYENNIAIRDAIANGEIDIGLINHYYVAEAIAKEGEDYPVKIHFPPGDLGSMINVAGVGILKSTDDKEEALAFVRELLDRKSQIFFAESSKEYPVIAGVPIDPLLVPLARIPAPDVPLGELDDLQGTVKLLRETGAL